MKLIILICCILGLEATQSKNTCNCPESSLSTNACPKEWIFPHIKYQGSMNEDGKCNVAFDWIWNDQEANPYLHFDCRYSNGESCNDEPITCGSCEHFEVSGINVDLNPTVDYNDVCGNKFHLSLRDICLTKSTYNWLIVPSDDYYCPSSTQCSGCPSNWDPLFQLHGSPVTSTLCDLTVSWNWQYDSNLPDNPNLIFVCIYAANGQFCESNARSVCASCGNTTFNNLDLSLDPYLDYSDSCSNIRQYFVRGCGDYTLPQLTTKQATQPTSPNTVVTTEKATVQTTQSTTSPTLPQTTKQQTQETTTQLPATPPPDQCTRICNGCPHNFETPHFKQEGTVVENNECNIDITWNYPEHEGEEVNMRFECIYDNGNHCQPDDEHVCGSCEEFLIRNVKIHEGPYIHYIDSCDHRESFPITDQCYVTPTTEKPKCTRICNGCPHNFEDPYIHQKGEYLEDNKCNIYLSWDYQEHEGEEVKMKFECIYENGKHCQPDDEEVCGSCEEFVIRDVNVHEKPELHYRDSCDNHKQFSVTEDCYRDN